MRRRLGSILPTSARRCNRDERLEADGRAPRTGGQGIRPGCPVWALLRDHPHGTRSMVELSTADRRLRSDGTAEYGDQVRSAQLGARSGARLVRWIALCHAGSAAFSLCAPLPNVVIAAC